MKRGVEGLRENQIKVEELFYCIFLRFLAFLSHLNHTHVIKMTNLRDTVDCPVMGIKLSSVRKMVKAALSD